ncbi:HAD-IA family hydrolase [Oryzibacter oryziterrae]|uniref:HAD-IA family hydrolase n=1 Tax=Oryzibacter oryziterrae TaxID=2766474 RepID=UPI001EFF88E0|nr:HAD-IA family hydrolase [Oryzibacter oryziterrae]
MSFRLVLFDCDGTLVDSQVMITSAMSGAFTALGVAPPSREETLAIVGLSLPIAMERLAKGRTDLSPDALADAYRAQFFTLRQSPDHAEPLYDGAREAIVALSARDDTLLGIVTGKSRRGVDAILAMHGLTEHFKVIRTADDGPSKPHPFMVADAVAAVGADVGNTVVIGDTSFDMEMGRAAGARTIGVTWGYHARGLLEATGAEMIAERFHDIPSMIDELMGQGA